MIAIMSCDVFPGLEKNNPLSSADEDVIPDKFGPKWYEYQDKPTKAATQPLVFKSVAINQDEEEDEESIQEMLESADPFPRGSQLVIEE